ncbi:hypothetical protein IJM86_05355 [bacterium]|nr:hypothetical protein [bacterium]
MLIDVVEQYDQEKKNYLKECRTKIVLSLSTQHDHKKILAFLSKVGVINIEEETKKVYIGFPNDFVLAQAKKIFQKSFKEAVHEVYNPQFDVEYALYPPFSNGNELLVDLKKILNIQDTPKVDPSTGTVIKKEFTECFGILIDPSYRFDNFIAGANNQFAFSAAKAVAENP